MKRESVRKSVALIVAAGLLVAVAGCSSSGSSAASCTPLASAGSASNLVTATGEFDKAPTVTFGTPLEAGAETQRTILTQGTGAVLQSDGVVSGDYTLLNGTTGATISKTKYDGSTFSSFPIASSGLAGIQKGLACATVGSRVAITMPPADGFGANGNAQASVGPTDSLVMVVDITNAYPGRANGAVQPAQAGFPSVALGPDGRPGITIPSGPKPTELKTAVLKKGDGAAVADGDQVIVQYTAVIWADTKTVAKSTWQDGAPTAVKASATADLATTIVPSLVGQTVGSQYITLVPPSAGYGATGSTDGTIPADSTLVYVVDVLGVLAVPAAK
ncbi:FKBP-type peptidyl-prolyl cis-trans isomerase [Subtercola sp. PAMC28395]|uniref:FKBP-type peptidyl-prolyl cis-trans isomerase n=1 Tax=Subtercola sp. PAMC28395 TaxID=2846775 RepID=UPI001C0E27F5|nr:FKBP-type peptidyl-prolyl cis-trans isomerase [Subtercola sp. PAMC28395]QWT23243.1 FKBP-type peptidyl-prolyl cis-trans isomerase [Subtercola sp. PAMC28395]